MKRGMLFLLLVCLAVPFGAPAEAMAEALPPGAIVVQDGTFPIACSVLADGGLLLTGFDGAPPGKSVEECLRLWQMDPARRDATAKPEPLDYFVAVYDTDGTRRWSYSFSFDGAYQLIYALPLPDDTILCLVQPYEPARGSRPETITGMFLLDAQGGVVPQPAWLTASFVQEELTWMIPLPGGWIGRAHPPRRLPSPYAQGLTLYDAGMRVVWHTGLEALRGYYTQSLTPVANGYVGYAIDLMSIRDDSSTDAVFCVYKLAGDGSLLWKHTLDKGVWVSGITVAPSGEVYAVFRTAAGGVDADPSPAALCLSAEGALLWEKTDYDDQQALSGLYPELPLSSGGCYMRGYRSWEVEAGWTAGENMLLRMDARGEIVAGLVYPRADARTEYFDMLCAAPGTQDEGFLLGALDALDGRDRWFILPVGPLLSAPAMPPTPFGAT